MSLRKPRHPSKSNYGWKVIECQTNLYITSNTTSSVCIYPQIALSCKALDSRLPDSRVAKFLSHWPMPNKNADDISLEIQQSKQQNGTPSEYAVCLAVLWPSKSLERANGISRDVSSTRVYPKTKQKREERRCSPMYKNKSTQELTCT